MKCNLTKQCRTSIHTHRTGALLHHLYVFLQSSGAPLLYFFLGRRAGGQPPYHVGKDEEKNKEQGRHNRKTIMDDDFKKGF